MITNQYHSEENSSVAYLANKVRIEYNSIKKNNKTNKCLKLLTTLFK